MTASRPRPEAPAQGQRIQTTGSIDLGLEFEHKLFPAACEQDEDGNAIENWMGSRIEHTLVASPTGRRAAITGDGLVTGFGIFGAPGTGKTHLVLHILRSLLDDIQPRPDTKFGGLILDPKAGLLDDIVKLWKGLQPHRSDDLIVVKPDLLNHLHGRKRGETADSTDPSVRVFEQLGIADGGHVDGINVIDCALGPTELGRMLVLAAQSAGVSAKEPFWFMAWGNLFSAALTLLEYTEDRVPTMQVLLKAILEPDYLYGKDVPNTGRHGASGMRRERGIEVLARQAREDTKAIVSKAHERLKLPVDQIQGDVVAAATQIESFFQSDYVRTIEAFITSAFGGFLQYKFRRLSAPSRWVWEKYRANGRPSVFDQIIEQGKVVLVTVGPEDPVMGKVLCTLIKCLFQQSVMSRLERFNSGRLTNFTRPVFIACDEFAEIASEVSGQPMGDGRFFSLARQNGCMGILATQSIHTLENSSLAQSWKSIFSNLAAKFFMGAADNETAEQACQLAGQIDWEMSSNTKGFGRDGSFSQQRSIVQRPELTPYVLTHVLKRGQAVALGSLDGRRTPPALRFIEVPNERTAVPKAVVSRRLGA